MKKVWKGAAAGILALSLGATGFVGASSAYAVDANGAAEAGSITVSDATATDTFTAYMPFTIASASVKGGTTTYAYKINTDDGFTADNLTAILNKLPEDKGFTRIATDPAPTEATVLNWLSENQAAINNNSALFAKTIIDGIKDLTSITPAFENAALDTAKTDLPAGFYVIEQTNSPAAGSSATDTVSKYIAGNVEKDSPLTKALKKDTVTSEKKVKENTKPTTGTYDDRINDLTWQTSEKWNDVADYNIGDTVDFMLAGTLPENYGDYTYYKYEFNDTLSDGLTFDGNIEVKAVKDSTETKLTDTQFAFYPNGQSFTLKVGTAVQGQTYRDLKGIPGIDKDTKIVVTYRAKVNPEAIIGLDGNTNKMTLTFSNNPNKNHEGDTGTTPEDKVIVFTYGLNIDKYNAALSTEKLAGAKFKLYKDQSKTLGAAVNNSNKMTGWGTATELETGNDGKITIQGLDSGTYYLEETAAPNGYNKIEGLIPVTITATTINNQTWDGTPSKALTALKVTVNGTDSDGSTSTGMVTAGIGNNKGTNLPSTGGMGTVVLYTVGGLIVLIAGVGLAVALRRRQA